MDAQLVASLDSGEGRELQVVRSPAGITITDGHALKGGHTIRLAHAHELVDLLDRALATDAPRDLIGSVPTAASRELHVKRWATAVSITDTPDRHSGWTLVLVDQVQALRDALATAVGSEASQVRSSRL